MQTLLSRFCHHARASQVYVYEKQGSGRGTLVVRCVQVKNPKCILLPTPKTSCVYISSGIITSVGKAAGVTTLEDSGCSGGSVRTS